MDRKTGICAPGQGMPFADGKSRSLLFLSLLCFALADVRDGLGPFLGVYLQGKGWNPDAIGFAMTVGGLAAMLCASPMGALADRSGKKRLLMGATVCFIVAGCAVIFLWTTPLSVGVSRLVQGAMSAAIAPTLSGITLGIVGQKALPVRLGRNQAWNHFGNGSSAVLGGLIGYYYGIPGVFFVLVCMSMLCLFCLVSIRPEHINHEVARGLQDEVKERGEAAPAPLRFLVANKALFVIALTVAFFHFGNAAMLPLLGQSAVARFDVNPAAYTAATVVIAQTTMICMALFGAWLAVKKGYGALFFIALLVLPLRGVVAGFYHSEWSVIPVQMLDGVGNGLMGVATPGIVARLLRGSGHINLGLGIVLTLKEVGASFSSAYGGLFAHHVSYSAAFLALAVAPCIGLLFFIASVKKQPILALALTRADV